MKRLNFILAVVVAVLAVSCGYRYESVEGDKLGTRIYTLDNGLKVYMSVPSYTIPRQNHSINIAYHTLP